MRIVEWLRLFRRTVLATAMFFLSLSCSVSGSQAQSSAPIKIASSTFLVAPSFPLGFAPSSVAPGDLRQSGKSDLVITDYDSGRINVFLGTGNGDFAPAASYDSGPQPSAVAVADIDGDGRSDVVVCNESDGAISLLRGSGDGTLQPRQSFSVGFNPSLIATGKFGGSGGVDIAVASKSGSQLAILLNDGEVGLQKPIFRSLSQVPAAITVADFNKDGRNDLALSNSNGTVNILLGDGIGQLRSLPDIGVVSGSLSSIVFGDFNKDGRIDLAVTQPDPKLVSVLLGRGDGTFIAASSYSVGNIPVSTLSADFDGDGITDLIVVNKGSNTFSILMGIGNGTFKSPLDFVTGNTPIGAVASDFDGDGHIDLAILNRSSQTVSVPLGNGDGTFKASRSYLAGQRPVSISSGNLNGAKYPGLAVTNYCGSDVACSTPGSVAIFLADDNGVYRIFSTYDVGLGPVSVLLADVNNDSNLDAIAVNRIDKTVSVLAGSGDGIFGQRITFPTMGFPVAAAVGDFNQDRMPDIAIVEDCGAGKCSQPSTLEILTGAEGGNFQSTLSYPAGYSPTSLTVGDINGDNKQDIIVANLCGNDSSCQTAGTGTVLLGDGTGKFTPGAEIALGNSPSSIELGNLSGSGIDLVVSRSADNTVAVLRGKGDGSFQSAVSYPVGAAPGSLVIADFNGDGKGDVAVTNLDDSTVSVLLGRGDATLLAATALPVGSGPKGLTAFGISAGGHASLATTSDNANSLAMGTSITVLPNFQIRPMFGSTANTTTLTATPNTTTVNAPITLDLTVTGGPPTPTGTVDITSNGTPAIVCSGLILAGAGTASCTPSALQANVSSLTATYSGDATYAVSTGTASVTVNKLSPTITMTPTPSPVSPAAINTPVTFFATLANADFNPVAPGGTVQFQSGVTPITGCTALPVNASQVATCTTAVLPVGGDSITAVYSGDANFNNATSAALPYTITKASPTLTTASSPASPTVNSAVTFTATLTGLFTPTPPTGTIAFADNLAPIGTCTAQGISASGPNYVATCILSNLAAGSHSISTDYIGDGNFNVANSAALPITIGQAATTLTIAAPGATAVNSNATFTATLHGTFTPTTPTTGSAVTSTVAFFADGSGTAISGCGSSQLQVTAGVYTATCTTNSLNATAHSISARYSGDTSFATSSTTTSASYTPTKLTGTLASASSVGATTTVGTQVTFTVTFTVTPVTPLEPGGNVSFTINGVADARCPAFAINASQQATCVTNGLTAGNYQIGASYAGDTNFNTATATAINLAVNKAAPTVGLTSNSVTPFAVNRLITFTATVPTPGTGVQTVLPTGTVTFKQGATTLCANAGLDASNPPQAVCPYSFPSPVAAPGIVTATYSGDSSFTAGTAGTTTGTVNTASTTTVTTSSGTVNVGQAVIYTTTLTPQDPGPPSYPQGTVMFTTNANPAPTGTCTTPLTVSGTGTAPNCTLIFSSGGPWNVFAQYVSSNSNFANSTSATVVQAVNNSSVGINLTSNLSPALVNQLVTFSAAFTPSIPWPVPSGNVTYADNGTTLCTVPISGTGTIPNCTYTFTSAGSHSILASFPGSGSYNAAGSNAMTQVVNHVPVTTTVTGPASATVNQTLTFTATLNGTFTPTAPTIGSSTTSTVAFFADGGVISGCSASPLAVNAGVYTATCTANSLSATAHNISAAYSGDSNFSTSVSSTISEVISPLAATLNLTSAPSNSTSVNNTVTFTAALGGVALTPIAPSGKVSFTANEAVIAGCSALPVDATGNTSCSASTLPAGTDQIAAMYAGDANFTVSSTGTVSLTVAALNPTLGVTASPSNSTSLGTPVTFTAQLAGVAFTPVIPRGTVRFSANGSTISGCWTVTVNASGEASCSTSALAPGQAAISAVYSRDANFTVSAPGTATQTVSKIPPTLGIALSSGANPSAYGATLTFTATVTGAGGFSPTGSVSFTDDGGPLNCINPGTLTSSGANASSAICNVPALAVGQHQISVAYVPATDKNYLPAGPTAPIGQTVNQANAGLSLTCTRVTYDGHPHSCVGSATGVAGAPISGTWSYSPSTATNAGSTPVTGTFTSSDADYANGTVIGTLMIDKAVPSIQVMPSSSSITTAQTLSVSVVVSGVVGIAPSGTVTLASGSYASSLTALLNGSATFDIQAGSLNTGEDTITATYSGEGNYSAATGFSSVNVAVPVNPSFAVGGTAVTVKSGATTANTSTITVTPSGGFTGNVAMTATVTSSPAGAQHPPTLSFGSTTPVTISGTSAGTAILTISTTAATSTAMVQPKPLGVPWYAPGATLACLLLLGIPKRRRRWLTILGVLTLILALTGGMVACGGSSTRGGGGGSVPGTTAGTYTVTVTGISGATITTGTVTLTVQ